MAPILTLEPLATRWQFLAAKADTSDFDQRELITFERSIALTCSTSSQFADKYMEAFPQDDRLVARVAYGLYLVMGEALDAAE